MTNNPISRYLDEIIDYGGIPTTRGEAILDMQSMGIDQPCIDRWLQGQELMASIRRRRDPIAVRLSLPEKDRARSPSRNRGAAHLSRKATKPRHPPPGPVTHPVRPPFAPIHASMSTYSLQRPASCTTETTIKAQENCR